MKLQLIQIDEKTNQPVRIEVIENGVLDMKMPLQKQLYLNTLQHLSPATEVYSKTDGDMLFIHLQKLSPNNFLKKQAKTIEVYNPSSENNIEILYSGSIVK